MLQGCGAGLQPEKLTQKLCNGLKTDTTTTTDACKAGGRVHQRDARRRGILTPSHSCSAKAGLEDPRSTNTCLWTAPSLTSPQLSVSELLLFPCTTIPFSFFLHIWSWLIFSGILPCLLSFPPNQKPSSRSLSLIFNQRSRLTEFCQDSLQCHIFCQKAT